jgi:6-phosphogluconolactonase
MKILKDDKKTLEIKATNLIKGNIDEVLRGKDYFVLTLAGGNSVKGVFEELSNLDIPWSKVYIFLADERLNTDDTNYINVYDNLISKIDIPKENFISPDNIDLYNKQFEKHGSVADLILLGVGEDGHIASIFPNHESFLNDEEVKEIDCPAKILKSIKNLYVLTDVIE